ncbi:MAG: glycosyltransferase family 4 protein [Bacillota bacterium]|nr:glycosyltransferase family 4 protein [Bacillota bacterium]
MKIGLFTDSYYPQINGVATSVHVLKQQLEADGHRVYVFTTTDPLADRHAEVRQGVFRMRSIPVMSERRLGVWYSPRMVHFFTQLDLDLVHTHTEFSLGIFGRTVARLLNVPLVHTYHTIYEEYTHFVIPIQAFGGLARRLARQFSTSVCNIADRVIVPTAKVRRLLRSYGVYRPIAVIPTGLRLDRFLPAAGDKELREKMRAELGYGPDDLLAVSVGRVSREKGLDVLLEAFKQAVAVCPRLYLLVVGSGPDAQEIQELSRTLGLEKRVQFVGAKPWDEIGRWYRVGDVFVSASRSETQGLTYIEALASGLPVLARSDAVLEGVVDTGVNGWQWDEIPDFVDRCRQLETLDQADWAAYSQAALEKAERYSVERYAADVASIYQQLLDVKEPGRTLIRKLEGAKLDARLLALSRPLSMSASLEQLLDHGGGERGRGERPPRLRRLRQSRRLVPARRPSRPTAGRLGSAGRRHRRLSVEHINRSFRAIYPRSERRPDDKDRPES